MCSCMMCDFMLLLWTVAAVVGEWLGCLVGRVEGWS
jgi:hypothetical protein